MRSRRGLSVLVLCGLVLGLMAIAASGAQAGTWMVNKETVKAGVELKGSFEVEIEPLGEKKEKHLVILTVISLKKVEILCGKVAAPSATFKTEILTTTFELSECKTFIDGKASPECNLTNQPIALGNTIRMALDFGKSYAKMEGSGGQLAILEFNKEICSALTLPAVKITGVLWLDDFNFEFEVEKETHLWREARAPAELLGGAFIGLNEVIIDGSFNVKFIDLKHLIQPFSGLAE